MGSSRSKRSAPHALPHGSLPHSNEAEQAVLGAVFLEPSLLPKLRARLAPEDFYVESHRLIFKAMGRIRERGATPDILTVQAALEDCAALEQVGGLAYLASLDVALPDLSRVDTYTRIVEERSRRRAFLETSFRAQRSVRAGDEQAHKMVESLAGLLPGLLRALNGHGPESFPPLEELPAAVPRVEPMPEELIPGPLRPWVLDAAARLNVWPELVAAPAVVAASAVLGRRLAIRPRQADSWTVVANLWGAVVAPPGQKKSPAIKEALGPAEAIQEALWEEHEERALVAGVELTDLRVREAAIKKSLEAAYRRTGRSPSREQSPEQLRESLTWTRRQLRAKEAEAAPRRLIIQDSTIEKLQTLKRDNPNGLLLYRDELHGWVKALDRADRPEDRSFYISCWSGDQGHVSDRIGRGTTRTPPMCLSVLGGIQPGKLRSYVQQATSGGVGADGLLQRFQLLIWPDGAPAFTLEDRKPEARARERVETLFRRLFELEPQAPEVGDEVPYVRFTPEAQEVFNRWLEGLEGRLRAEALEPMEAFASHIAKYRSLMPSLALLFHLLETEGAATAVSAEAAELAERWCAWLESHARKVYAPEVGQKAQRVHLLAEALREGELGESLTVRDVYNRRWPGLRTADAVREALGVLEEHGHVKLLREAPPGGGRPTEKVLVNPALFDPRS